MGPMQDALDLCQENWQSRRASSQSKRCRTIGDQNMCCGRRTRLVWWLKIFRVLGVTEASMIKNHGSFGHAAFHTDCVASTSCQREASAIG